LLDHLPIRLISLYTYLPDRSTFI